MARGVEPQLEPPLGSEDFTHRHLWSPGQDQLEGQSPTVTMAMMNDGD
jgi:hypothetical protein